MRLDVSDLVGGLKVSGWVVIAVSYVVEVSFLFQWQNQYGKTGSTSESFSAMIKDSFSYFLPGKIS
jgi:hypothetical protein